MTEDYDADEQQITKEGRKLIEENAELSRMFLKNKELCKIFIDKFKHEEAKAEESLYRHASNLIGERGGNPEQSNIRTAILAFKKMFFASLGDVPADWIQTEANMKADDKAEAETKRKKAKDEYEK